jgi:DNA-binding transcriptional ArsR family regulator
MIGDPTRATMLGALLGGEALPAGELARRAGIAPATATSHLARLVETGLLLRRQSGRHHYFTLASPDVAAALEALGRITHGGGSDEAPNGSIRFARTCYDHLARILGVSVTDRLREREFIAGTDAYQLTPAGGVWLQSLGVDVDALRHSKRVVARPCLDWTERRDHLAGAAGAAVATLMLERRWVTRVEGTRAVRLTLSGREALFRLLGLQYR